MLVLRHRSDVQHTRGDLLLHVFVFCCSVLGRDCVLRTGHSTMYLCVPQGEPCLRVCCYPGAQCMCSQVKHVNDFGSGVVS